MPLPLDSPGEEDDADAAVGAHVGAAGRVREGDGGRLVARHQLVHVDAAGEEQALLVGKQDGAAWKEGHPTVNTDVNHDM